MPSRLLIPSILLGCNSEIASAFPFSGGAYGVGRVVLGFFPGFLVGCNELLGYSYILTFLHYSLVYLLAYLIPQLLEYIIYVSITFMTLAQMIGGPSTLAPLLIFLFYVISLVILIKGDYIFWIFNNILVINNPNMYSTTGSPTNSFFHKGFCIISTNYYILLRSPWGR